MPNMRHTIGQLSSYFSAIRMHAFNLGDLGAYPVGGGLITPWHPCLPLWQVCWRAEAGFFRSDLSAVSRKPFGVFRVRPDDSEAHVDLASPEQRVVLETLAGRRAVQQKSTKGMLCVCKFLFKLSSTCCSWPHVLGHLGLCRTGSWVPRTWQRR